MGWANFVAVLDFERYLLLVEIVVVVDAAVGVPLITPLELMLRPDGSEGDELQKALSPVFDGVMLEMGVPTVNVNGEPV